MYCQSNNFRYFHIKYYFNDFTFSSDTNIFPDKNLKKNFTECNSIATPVNDSAHPVSMDSKYHEISYYNRLTIDKNSTLATFHLNMKGITEGAG